MDIDRIRESISLKGSISNGADTMYGLLTLRLSLICITTCNSDCSSAVDAVAVASALVFEFLIRFFGQEFLRPGREIKKHR